MNKSIVSIIVLIVVIVAGVYLLKQNVSSPAATENEKMTVEENTNGAEATPEENVLITTTVTTVTETSEVKSFVINGSNFAFAPSSIKVKKGDTVKITLKNVGGTHDLKIDEFKVATAKLADGKEETVTFVADKSGTFEYYCSVGNHRAMGMKGALIVE